MTIQVMRDLGVAAMGGGEAGRLVEVPDAAMHLVGEFSPMKQDRVVTSGS